MSWLIPVLNLKTMIEITERISLEGIDWFYFYQAIF